MKKNRQLALKLTGLRRRWLTNTLCVVMPLAIVCVFAVTAVFAAYYYSGMESDLRYRARTTTDFFAENMNASSVLLSCGANPPSSPTAVLNPIFFSTFLRA